MKTYRFQTEMLQHEGMDAAYILFPYSVKQEFDTLGQVKVRAVFDDSVEYRGSLAKMGMAQHCLGVPKKIREQLGKKPGDRLGVTITKDEEPRVVPIPEDLRKELSMNGLEEAFGKLSYTKRKNQVESVLGAKKPETRVSRINAIINALRKSD
ncbi:YdeI/OmpD-associated family protein [Paenibacillus macerans]|uniref:YdeI/OmpD-associated family protein n=1 Tax=Paenibacillus macerans TaxID=44252 RepID=UPI003D31FC04